MLAADERPAAKRRRERAIPGQLLNQVIERSAIQICAVIEHRAVQPHQPRAAVLPQQQGRDVAVANQRLGGLAECFGIEHREDPIAAVAAAGADDSVDSGVIDQFHEFGNPARIVSGQVAVAGEQVVSLVNLETRIAQQRHTIL